jgi:hypothetical protein
MKEMMQGQDDAFPFAAVMEQARYAPSAHNAQPWRCIPNDDGTYRVLYAYEDKLLTDPDDRDGMLALGAFIETFLLVAATHGWDTSFTPRLRYFAYGIETGYLQARRWREGEDVDPLAAFVTERRTNRHLYDQRPLPRDLQPILTDLGCVLVPPKRLRSLVEQASMMAWQDNRFVRDLAQWTRFRDGLPDGMSPACLTLSPLEQVGVRLSVKLGRLPRLAAWLYARWDLRLLESSSAVAVMPAADRDPLTLVDCGRRLLRCWVAITAHSFSCHPESIVIDQPTAKDLARMLGIEHPVAIFRVGHTAEPAAPSERRAVAALVRDPGMSLSSAMTRAGCASTWSS